MANTKVTQHVIADDAITTAMITDANVTPAKLHGTLDLSSKTLTLPAVAIPSASTATTQSAADNSTKVATTAYVTTALANLVDSSPSDLNTLNELAAALNDDASFSSTVTTSIAAKLPLAGGTMTGDLILGDNVKIEIGSGSGGDLQIYHDGTSSYIVNTTNDLVIKDDTRIRLRTPSLMVNNDADTENMLTATENGAVTLYYDNSAKLATAAYGVDAQGTGALKIPVGTTGQRPTAATGQLRWNTTDGALEVYNGSAWTAVGTGSSNKILDTFTGDNSTTDFTLSVTPANEDALMVFIDGVYQEKGDYTLTNAVLALDTAPASGEKIAVHITTASVHDGTSAVNQQFTATAGQTAFTLSSDPGSENNTQVYINGVYQQKTDYTVSGTTLTFDTGLTVGDVVEVNSFTVATLGNTDTVTEGTTNLYHTTARARSAISVSGNALSYNSSTGVITSAYEESPVFTGNVTLGSSTAGALEVGSANSFQIQKSGVTGYINQSDSGPIIVRMGSGFAEKLRLTNVGSGAALGVGITPEGAYSGYSSIEFGQQGAIFANVAADDFGLKVNTYLDSGGNWKRKETGVASSLDFDGDQIKFFTAASGSADANITFAQKLRIDNDGIKFGADTAAANALDDYEEGTWTPACGATLSTASGQYTKIGNQVTVHYHIVSTGGLPGSGGHVIITGLPFTSNSGSLTAAPIYARYYSPNDSTLTSLVQDGESQIRLINTNDTSFDYTVWGELEGGGANNSIYIIGSATYIV